MRLAVAVRLYLNARRPELAPASRRHLAESLALAVRHIGPDVLVRSLRRKHVESWLAAMDNQPGTIRTRLSALRGFSVWAVAHGHLKTDPTLGIKGPRAPTPMPRELDREAVTKTLGAAPDIRGELIVLLAVQEGMRVSEIAGLSRENVDLSGAMMLVRGKGNRERWLPISAETLDTLHAYLRRHPGTTGPVIRSERHPNRGITSKYLAAMIAQFMYDAGVKDHPYDGVSGHALRHSFSGAMLDDGADIRELQAALGHASLSATYVYTRRRTAATQLRKSMGQRTYRA